MQQGSYFEKLNALSFAFPRTLLTPHLPLSHSSTSGGRRRYKEHYSRNAKIISQSALTFNIRFRDKIVRLKAIFQKRECRERKMEEGRIFIYFFIIFSILRARLRKVRSSFLSQMEKTPFPPQARLFSIPPWEHMAKSDEKDRNLLLMTRVCVGRRARATEPGVWVPISPCGLWDGVRERNGVSRGVTRSWALNSRHFWGSGQSLSPVFHAPNWGTAASKETWQPSMVG